MVLHYAKLCASAGGVDAFLIGSELRGLTTIRSAAATFPFVSALVTLAAEVKAILTAAKITYGADWSEYSGYHPGDGSNDVYFHLDPLWASSGIDAVGIDNYMPLTDWRDGNAHLDRLAGNASIYDASYLRAGIAGGEGFDWYYASQAARDAQLRTAITDGAYGKPWVFRNKDVKSWWLNQHFNRPLGVQSPTPTSWVPQSKPVWFTELGCPAVDKATNQPNVFVDAKSSENAVPYYSSGNRDDVILTRFVKVVDDYWHTPGAHNPVSSVYGLPMVDAERIFLWSWDARPYPVFPLREDIWSDGSNYARGHWLNGRIGALGLDQIIRDVCLAYGLSGVDVGEVAALVDGFVVERPMSARDALENLIVGFGVDAVESEGLLKFRNRRRDPVLTLSETDFVETDAQKPLYALHRAQETELPNGLKLAYADSLADYRSAVVEVKKQRGASARETVLELPCATSQSVALQRAHVLLQENWSGRETLGFSLAPSRLAIEPGDVVSWGPRQLRVASIHDGAARKLQAASYAAAVYDPPPAPDRNGTIAIASIYGKPDVLMMDLAMATSANVAAPWIASQAKPWPGQLSLLKKSGTASFTFNRLIEAQATMGTLASPMAAGPMFVFDRATSFNVKLKYGALSSMTETELLGGANIAAIGDDATGYEIIQFASAELMATDTYRVKTLLRGQGGSAAEMLNLRPALTNFILLNGAVVQPILAPTEAGLENTWRIGPSQLDQGHAAYFEFTALNRNKGLRPLSPCFATARRDGADILLSWIRRTRVDGDGWEFIEVPLGEVNESYALEILAGATLRRSVLLTAPSYRYLAADIAADFGAMPTSLDVSIAQLSATYGPGTKFVRTLNV